ncbi:hypothetical protein CONPUDRAFT_75741 [Coniophora puteana RWD-64-598 SS2]|uniref:G-protein coupled receptors family 1 profile domain-containing protein n=1 Tax=Coniophora puteana (strain RWD-64-598) TaxID=741705 RepID=A0A5M3MG72_CONPW|nr:uncharacterized protein CONPUDRAFT_75741 [Coniophora puteana RWD-64-598 SS2]EIW77996.1 hypothetical protein CONPUDRAFT_75741 [Coniophora puteana RWD-64-598 SS2]
MGTLGYATWLAYDLSMVIIVFVLQGAMILRLYALYMKSRKVLALLSVALVAEQAVNVVIMVYEYRFISAVEESLLGSHICSISITVAWWIPVSNDVVVLAFHTMAAVLTLYHLVVYLKQRQQLLSLQEMLLSKDLRIILIRDNILCYLITVKLTALTTLADGAVIRTISLTVVTAVIGPRIILNIRSHGLRTDTAREFNAFTGRFQDNGPPEAKCEDTMSSWT